MVLSILLRLSELIRRWWSRSSKTWDAHVHRFVKRANCYEYPRTGNQDWKPNQKVRKQ